MFRLTPTVKNLLIINVIVFALQTFLAGTNLTELMAMYRIGSVYFKPYQFFTYMFAHAGFTHILFNMLGLVFLGVSLEMVWGGKKFLAFYVITGMGAGILYALIGFADTYGLKNDIRHYSVSPSYEAFAELIDDNKEKFDNIRFNGEHTTIWDFLDAYDKDREGYRQRSVQLVSEVEDLFITKYPGRVIGASGAIYAVLMAFGLLFPDRQLMLLFPPIPIKAKYLVLILGGMAVFMEMQRNPGDNVAHLVHLGGMFVGFIMVKFF